MTAVREAAVAGQFYPGSAAELETEVRRFLEDAAPGTAQGAAQGAALGTAQGAAPGTAQGAGDETQKGRVPKAIIAPHAGYVYSGAVAATAYARLEPARALIRRVVLLGPCHRVPVRGLALSGADAFATPLGEVRVDREATARIMDMPQVEVFDATHEWEHSLEVHLPFLQVALDDFALVPLVVGEAGPDEVAQVLDALWGGPETLIVVSSDLSHYLDYDSARRIDAETCRAIETLDPGAISRDGACGRHPVGGLLTIAKRRGMTVTTLDLRNSGDTAGPRNRVVGYGSWMFQERPLKRTATVRWNKTTEQTEGGTGEAAAGESAFGTATRALLARHGETLLRLGAQSILHGLAQGRPLAPAVAGFGAPLKGPGAAFVTLKREDRLRGCVGTSEAHRPLVADVADNAFRAAFKDPRFPPLTEEEIDGLDLSISVLSPRAPMAFSGEAELLESLRPGVDGLVIEDGKRRALFLPSVWSQLPQPEAFVERLKLKAGLAKDHWSGNLKAWRFVAEEIAAGDLDDPAVIWARAH